MESMFTRRFPVLESGTEASGVPVGWLLIAGHLERKFHGQNIAESHPLLLVPQCIACNVCIIM
jgi:hypothetical protein